MTQPVQHWTRWWLVTCRHQAILWKIMSTYCQLQSHHHISVKLYLKLTHIHFRKCICVFMYLLQEFCILYPWTNRLTHWDRDKMAAIFQTTFSNAFSWMKMHEFQLRFHWNLFLRVQLTIFQHWSVHIMAWRRPGDKPLSEPMMLSLLAHSYMRHSASTS